MSANDDKTKRDSLGIGPNALRSVLSDPNAEARQRSLKAQLEADIELRHAIEKRNEMVEASERQMPGVGDFGAEEMLGRIEKRTDGQSSSPTPGEVEAGPRAAGDKLRTSPKLGVHADELGALEETVSQGREGRARSNVQLVWMGLLALAAIVVVLVLALRGDRAEVPSGATSTATDQRTSAAPVPTSTSAAGVTPTAVEPAQSVEPASPGSSGPSATAASPTARPTTTSTSRATSGAPTSAYSGWRMDP